MLPMHSIAKIALPPFHGSVARKPVLWLRCCRRWVFLRLHESDAVDAMFACASNDPSPETAPREEAGIRSKFVSCVDTLILTGLSRGDGLKSDAIHLVGAICCCSEALFRHFLPLLEVRYWCSSTGSFGFRGWGSRLYSLVI